MTAVPAPQGQAAEVVMLRLCDGSETGPQPGDDCPNARDHTDAPGGYLAWHKWAREMSRTHRQRLCPGCDRFRIWEPR